jgi:hypothetical protein
MIDSFLYFNEEELFFLRVEYLNPYVEKFVIVETDTTFSLLHHPKTFDKVYNKLPEDIKKKIVYHYLEVDKSFITFRGNNYDDPAFKYSSRYVEQQMRNSLASVVKNTASTGWMSMSDLDEIWDTRKLDEAKKIADQYGKVFWAQDTRVAFIDWQPWLGKWPGSKTCRIENMPDPIQILYPSKNKTWGSYGDAKIEAGWHFTTMGNQQMKQEQIAAKRESPSWRIKLNKTYEQLSSAMFRNEYNTIVKKSKMKANKIPEEKDLDPRLYSIAKKYPCLWSGKIRP